MTLAVFPFSAGIAWLPAMASIVVAIIALIRKSAPTWAAVVALVLGPLAWLTAIVVTVVSWALISASSYDAQPAAAPAPVVEQSSATPAPQYTLTPASPQDESAPSAEPAAPPAEAPPASEVPAAPAPPALPGPGAVVEIEDWQFTVLAVGAPSATVGSEYWPAEAQGEFVPVQVRVQNVGTSAESFGAGEVMAYDGAGREFEYSSDAMIYADDSLSWYDEINPGNTVEGTIYFDVPTGTVLERISVSGGWFSEPVEIALR